MLSRARFTETLRRQTALAKKIYDVVPDEDWHTPQRIFGTLSNSGTYDFAAVRGTLDSLKRDDLVVEDNDGCFRRAPVRAPYKRRDDEPTSLAQAMSEAVAAKAAPASLVEVQQVIQRMAQESMALPETPTLADVQQAVTHLGVEVLGPQAWAPAPEDPSPFGTRQITAPPVDPFDRLDQLAHKLGQLAARHQQDLASLAHDVSELACELLLKQEADAKAAAKLNRLLKALGDDE